MKACVMAMPITAQGKPFFKDTVMLSGGRWRVHDADRPFPIVVARAANLGGAPAQEAGYIAHADAAPIQLQDRGSPVSFRDIWVRPLTEAAIAQDLRKDGK